MTQMSVETKQAPLAVQRMLGANADACAALGKRLRETPPAFVVTCARGSSDHAATYAKYVIETQLGVMTASAAPSISSVYGVEPRMDNALFIAISQSGQSPDLLATTKAALNAGALVVALVNVETSPLAEMADIVLPLHAGEETSVAATKSYITSLAAIAQLVAHWSGKPDLMEALSKLSDQLQEAEKLDWSAAVGDLAEAEHLLVVGRAAGFGIAQEAALKFKETCCLHAEPFSAAEIRHGPMAILKNKIATLVFSQKDETQAGIVDLLDMLSEQGGPVYSVGVDQTPTSKLGYVGNVHPVTAPITMIQSFYKMVNQIALTRGLNPDQPPLLRKVTETK